jgi:hypothetical protein
MKKTEKLKVKQDQLERRLDNHAMNGVVFGAVVVAGFILLVTYILS